MIRDVKEFLDERGLKYEDDIEPHLDQGIETANYLRSINCPATIVLRLSGYTRDNNISKTWSIPKKWRFLINAPFPISEHCCDLTTSKKFVFARTICKSITILYFCSIYLQNAFTCFGIATNSLLVFAYITSKGLFPCCSF